MTARSLVLSAAIALTIAAPASAQTTPGAGVLSDGCGRNGAQCDAALALPAAPTSAWAPGWHRHLAFHVAPSGIR